jgi:2'-5' RNA ligase
MAQTSAKQEELFYLISPPQSVHEFVSILKTHVEDILGHSFESRFSKAHVSLLKDSQQHAESFLYDAEEKIRAFRPFMVPVRNLKVLWEGQDKRTIYLDISYKTPICEIFETLAQRSLEFTPHIAIAKNLEVIDFLKVWKGLKDISYSYDFHCDHITVLKKSGSGWIHHIDLPLAGR